MKLIETNSDTRHHLTAAKNIRIELKAAFPAIKFRVTSESYTGGNVVNIEWIDGPTARAVDDLVSKYRRGTSNSYDDSYTFTRTAFTEKHGSAMYLRTTREYSDVVIDRLIVELAAKWSDAGDKMPTAVEFRAGLLSNARFSRHTEAQDMLIFRSLEGYSSL